MDKNPKQIAPSGHPKPADRVYDVSTKGESTMLEILEHPATWRLFDEFIDQINNALDEIERREKVREQLRGQFAIRKSFNN